MPYNAAAHEREILAHWEKTNAFQKSIDSRPADNPYVFYDGPPFATGLPHYGHIIASLIKDVVPRYWTMRGKRVERVWGWDCHGLPVENLIEKELNLSSKKDIEVYGVDRFNEACKSSVLRYAEEWKKTITRMGRWVDMEHAYHTMDISYMESVWWVFAELYKKGLIYEGKKPMHICPRCVTALSNFEVTQGYKDIKDISVTARFLVTERGQGKCVDLPGNLYILAWTTTPWTLPGNVLLAVGKSIEYSVVLFENEHYIVAKDRLMHIFEGKAFEVVDTCHGSDLVGMGYEPLFPYYLHEKNGFRVVSGAFVTTADGTGVVHIAPAFGEDDYQLCLEHDAPFIQHVSMDGRFVPEVVDFAGHEVKPLGDHTRTDVEIVKYLAHHGRLFVKAKYEHSYPHCWRCDTPLLNYATSSWFVRVTELKSELLANNAKTSWVPDHIKDGRFGNWLEGARDWAISRSRFWGAPLPIWRSEDGEILCIGSVAELEALSGKKVDDLHKQYVDEIVIEKDGKTFTRIPEVLDCWFESGAMPYGELHYPFENKEKFEASFPAEFIAEGQDQTRGWFYTLHILATALTRGESPSIPGGSRAAFRNVIVNGMVMAEDGKKMSKRLQNYPDPLEVLERYGADALRYYFVTSPVMHSEKLNFAEAGVREIYNKLLNTVWNVYSFYAMFGEKFKHHNSHVASNHVLDQWIMAKLQLLISDVREGMDAYRLADASRPIVEFVSELSQWYVRRSRDRFKMDVRNDTEVSVEAHAGIATLHQVLYTLAHVMAPFTPFIAEKLYLSLGGTKESIHLEDFPEARTLSTEDQGLLESMAQARQIVEIGLALRANAKVKVRQALGTFFVHGVNLSPDFKAIIADELNVQQVSSELPVASEYVILKEENGLTVGLDTEITVALKKEGMVREVVRVINQIRKEKGYTIEDRVSIMYHTDDTDLAQILTDYAEEIMRSTLSTTLTSDTGTTGDKQQINDASVVFDLKRV